MPEKISFTVLGRAEPQGSVRAFMIGGKPRLTSDNKKMKPWRQQVGFMALSARPTNDGWAAKHMPVEVTYRFYFAKPPSAPKRRLWPVVKPDWDKISRACGDALTGILYHDDAQVVRATVSKEYGSPERTEITVTKL